MRPRLWLLLLRFYPRELREAYGDAMHEMFVRRLDEARATGGGRVLRLWSRELMSAVGAGLRRLVGQAAGAATLPARGPRRGGGAGRLALELRFAARRLLRSPAFSLAAGLTLALALAANAAIYTLVRRVLLEPLPYPASDRIVYLDLAAPGLRMEAGVPLSEALAWHLHRNAHTLEDLALYQSGELAVAGQSDVRRVNAVFASPSLGRVLRVTPRLGRWFSDAEGVQRNGEPCVVVLSHGEWVQQMGSDPAVLGRTLRTGVGACEIIGVMPPGFAFPDAQSALYVPLRLDTANLRMRGLNYKAVARMAPGVTVAELRAEVDRLIAGLPAAFPGNADIAEFLGPLRLRSVAVTLRQHVVGSIASVLWVLLGAVAIVLLVGCANVANLFLVRAEARRREVAVRRALGAGRTGVALSFLAESAWLSLISGGAGLLLGYGAVHVLLAVGPRDLPRLDEVRVDAGVVALTALLTVLAGSFLSLLPMLRLGRWSALALREGGRGATTSRSHMRVRHVLMGAQVAMVLVLLLASGLLTRSFLKLLRMDLGFDASEAVLVRTHLQQSNQFSHEARLRAAASDARVLDRLRALPGVRLATATTCPPLGPCAYNDALQIADQPLPAGASPRVVAMRRVASGFFEVLGMRLRAGRFLGPQDDNGATNAVVINRALADRFFARLDPVGQRIYPDDEERDPHWFTVVGVVDNTPGLSLRDSADATVYFPLSDQDTGPLLQVMSFVLRTASPAASLLNSVRAAVRETEPAMSVALAEPLSDVLSGARAQWTFEQILLATAAGMALLLGLVGIYGVMAYGVSQRASEIGVRLALGAEPRAVAGMILRQGAAITSVGIAAGLLCGLASSRLIAVLLFRVGAHDPATWFAVTVLVLLMALGACWLPARRAARLDPLSALQRD